MTQKGRHRQPVGYRRKGLHASIEARIWEAVGELADTFKHTRAWVVNVILAEYLHIKLDDTYFMRGYAEAPGRKRQRKSRRK